MPTRLFDHVAGPWGVGGIPPVIIIGTFQLLCFYSYTLKEAMCRRVGIIECMSRK